MIIGIAALVLLAVGVALGHAVSDALWLRWLRTRQPVPRPDSRRVWEWRCRLGDHGHAHPAHMWRRNALTSGGVPVSHPNWCPGLRPWAAPR